MQAHLWHGLYALTGCCSPQRLVRAHLHREQHVIQPGATEQLQQQDAVRRAAVNA